MCDEVASGGVDAPFWTKGFPVELEVKSRDDAVGRQCGELRRSVRTRLRENIILEAGVNMVVVDKSHE